MSIEETIDEVLRLDAEATPGPWDALESSNPEDPAPFVAETGMGDVITGDVFYTPDADLIAYYRTAAPALAREVQRLRAERDAAHQERYRAGQEAMRERCAALCDDWEEDTYCDGWQEMEQGAQHCAEAIRTLEVSP